MTPGQEQIQRYHQLFFAAQTATTIPELLQAENDANSDHMWGWISTPQYKSLFAEAEARRAELTA